MITTYFMNNIAGNVFLSKTLPPLPTSLYLALSTTIPTVAGLNITEPNPTTGYTRVRLIGLSEPVNGEVHNNNMISFPESIISWGEVSSWVLYETATSTDALMFGSFITSKRVEAQTALSIRPNELSFSVGQIANS